ncbi:type VI secretion system protein TssA [Pseudomonas nicosulfuronedens]
MSTEFIQKLLSPLHDGSVCGSELEYDAEYIELQVAAAEREEQQFGSTIIPAQQPNWSDVAHRANQLFGRTKDLRVLAYLARARAELEGLPGYCEVLGVAVQWLKRYWDELYPRIVIDGEADPMLRINAIAALMDTQGIGRALRNAPLVQGDFGSFSLRDLESQLEADPNDPGSASGGKLRQILSAQDSVELKAVRTIDTTLRTLNQLVEQQLDASWMPDFSTFARPFKLIVRALDDSQGQSLPSEVQVEHAAQIDTSVHPRGATTSPERREQAIQMMEGVCRYFERYEPGHPAILLVRRAQRLMPMTFMEIIQDMVPESGQPFGHILGVGVQTGTE